MHWWGTISVWSSRLRNWITNGLAWLWLPACTSTTSVAPSRVGNWYATDLHIHTSEGSNDTDGQSFVATHVDVAQQRGLDLLVFTDHSNSAGSMDCASGDVEDCPNQGPEFPAMAALQMGESLGVHVAVGVEISPVESLDNSSVPTGHIGCLPTTADAFSDNTQSVVDRPVGTVSGGAGIEWCHAQGGMAVVNHPYALAPWIAYDWSQFEYDAIEVFNGGARFDQGDQDAVHAWLCDLAQGRDVVAVGGSDTHRAHTETPPPSLLDQALGFPTTWVWSETDDLDGILGGLQNGRTIVGDPNSALDVYATSSTAVAGPGGTIRGPVEVYIEASVEQEDMRLELLNVPSDGCVVDDRTVDGSVPVVNVESVLTKALESGEQLQVTLDVKENALLVARVWPNGEMPGAADGVVIAAPIRIVK